MTEGGDRCRAGVRDDDRDMSTTPASPVPRRTAVLLLAGLLLVACAMRSPITGVGPVLPFVSHDLGLSAAAAGALTSLPLVAFAASSLVVPRSPRGSAPAPPWSWRCSC